MKTWCCFGWARELEPAGFVGEGAAMAPADAATPKEPFKGWPALEAGQAAGAVLDMNRDNAPDLLAVMAGTPEAWVLYGENHSQER